MLTTKILLMWSTFESLDWSMIQRVKWLRRRFNDSVTIQFPTIHLTQNVAPESCSEASPESTVNRLLWTLLISDIMPTSTDYRSHTAHNSWRIDLHRSKWMGGLNTMAFYNISLRPDEWTRTHLILSNVQAHLLIAAKHSHVYIWRITILALAGRRN